MRKVAIGLAALATLSIASAWGADLPTKKPACPDIPIESDAARLSGTTGDPVSAVQSIVNPASTTTGFVGNAPATTPAVNPGVKPVSMIIPAGAASDVKAAAALEPNARAEVGTVGGTAGGLSAVARQTRDDLIANPSDITAIIKKAAEAPDSATRQEIELGIVRAIRYTYCYDPSGYRAIMNGLNALGGAPSLFPAASTGGESSGGFTPNPGPLASGH